MLGGDKSLKEYLAFEEIVRNTKTINARIAFEGNKDKLESFYKTNIEDIIEGKNKLAEAREVQIQETRILC
jgi:hypothetical protein